MKAGKTASMIMFALVFLIGTSLVSAATPGEANVNGATDLGEYLFTTGDTVSVEAGNVTRANVEGNASTYRWAGLFGNVTGSIVLGDATEKVLFEWTAAGNLVFASQGATIDWPSLVDANEAAVTAAYTYLATGNSDAYDTTFVNGAENIGSNIWTTLTSDFAYTRNNESVDTWKTYSLTDGSEMVFAGLVSENGRSYDNEIADFQMIIPEDGTAGDTTAQTYNLWIELV